MPDSNDCLSPAEHFAVLVHEVGHESSGSGYRRERRLFCRPWRKEEG
jgi:hypothetical protein